MHSYKNIINNNIHYLNICSPDILLKEINRIHQFINDNIKKTKFLIKEIESCLEENKRKRNLGITGFIGSIFLSGINIIGGLAGIGTSAAVLSFLKKENELLEKILEKANNLLLELIKSINKISNLLKENEKKIPIFNENIKNLICENYKI